jgi:hypothetical protein
MKTLWKIVLATEFFVIILIVSIPFFIVFLNADKIDTFYILNASLRNPEYLYELENRLAKEDAYRVLDETPSVYAHRLKRGGGTILAYRWFSRGGSYVMDDERFEKITIWLPELPSERVSTFDISDRTSVIVVYTKGASAWPDIACSGYLNAGQLIVRRKGKRLVVTVEGTLQPLAVLAFANPCNSRTIENEFHATEIDHHELTTWLGKPGSHPYYETYR